MRAPRSHARGQELPNSAPSCHVTAVAYLSLPRPCRLSSTQARKGRTPMPSTALQTALQADIMIALVLASDPGQVGITRCLVRAALEYRGLGHYAPEAEIIASELVTNAIQHARSTDPADKIGVTLVRVWDREAVSVVVTDSSPLPPVRHETMTANEQGRGLQIVEALSARWGWNQEQGGKAVYAILAK